MSTNQYTPNNRQGIAFQGHEASISLQMQEIIHRLKKSIQEQRRTNELLQNVIFLLLQNGRGAGAFDLFSPEPFSYIPHLKRQKKKKGDWII